MLSRLRKRILAAILLSLTSILLLSCQNNDSPAALFDNYLYRLSNSLRVELPSSSSSSNSVSSVALTPYPSQRSLRKTIPAMGINVLEFLRLSQCDLQKHIGQRNSGLGKLMAPTQQLIYDIRFIDLAQQCLQILDPSSPLYTTVQQALEHKQRYLNDVMWNASFSSDEFSTLFSLGVEPLSVTDAMQASLLLSRALDGLYQGFSDIHANQVSSGFIDRLEDHYRIIGSVKRVGEIRLAMRQVVFQLAKADQLLQQRNTSAPLCFHQQANKQSAIVETVFQKYYIGEVQAYIAQLHQQGQRLLSSIEHLSSLYTTPPIFQLFWGKVYQQQGSEWQQFQQAIARHTQHWQTLLRQCGRLPS